MGMGRLLGNVLKEAQSRLLLSITSESFFFFLSVSSGFVMTYTTSDTSGVGSARCTERGGLRPRPQHPVPCTARSRENATAPRRNRGHVSYPGAGLGWRGQA